MTNINHLHRVTAWLTQLAEFTQHRPNPVQLDARIAAIASFLADGFPSDAAFTRTSLEWVAGECPFFPSYAEITKALGAWWKDHRPVAPVGRAIEAPAPPPPHERPSEEQMAINRELVRQTAAVLHRAADAKVAASRSAPREERADHLSDGQLLATYEKLAADGDRLALTRLEMLRKKLAQPE